MERSFLIGVLGVGVGLALGLALGLGAGANLNALGVLSPTHTACVTPPLSARARFLACSVSEADVSTPEELELMLAQRQGRAATPAWGVP